VEVKARVTLVTTAKASIKDPCAHDCLIRTCAVARTFLGSAAHLDDRFDERDFCAVDLDVEFNRGGARG
jgi:hypothetical protein